VTDYGILAKPRIQPSTFERILAEAKSPAAAEAAAAWKGITRHGVDPAFALAIFRVESNFGKRGRTVTRRNWGGLSTSEAYPDDGLFALYPTWADGARDTARLLVKYGRNSIQVGRKTDTAGTFAPVFRGSDSATGDRKYGEAIMAAITRFVEQDREWSRPDAARTGPLLGPPARFDQETVIDTYTAAARASRIRAVPHLGGAIMHTVGSGAAIGVDRVVEGGSYTTEEKRSNRWLRVVAVNDQPLPAPLFTSAVLWRRSEDR
jgi:hypothetical protein